MTRNVVTVTRETSLAEIAELMDRHRIKRVPVVENGELVGIVSRLDLVRAVYVHGMTEARPPLDDAGIQAKLAAEIARQGWKLDPSAKIVVFEGVVHLFGNITCLRRAQERALAERFASATLHHRRSAMTMPTNPPVEKSLREPRTDLVELCSLDSFPASDPPPWTLGRTSALDSATDPQPAKTC
jgi:hypothetical protein